MRATRGTVDGRFPIKAMRSGPSTRSMITPGRPSTVIVPYTSGTSTPPSAAARSAVASRSTRVGSFDGRNRRSTVPSSHAKTSASRPSPTRARPASSPPGMCLRLEDDEGDVAVRARLVLRVATVCSHNARPELRLLVCRRDPGPHWSRSAVHRDLDVRAVAEVEVPVGMAVFATGRRHGHHALASAGGQAQVHVLIEEAVDAFDALAAAGIEVVSEEEVAIVPVADRPGELGQVSRQLGDAGVNITLAYLATSTRLVFAADDFAKAKAALQ